MSTPLDLKLLRAPVPHAFGCPVDPVPVYVIQERSNANPAVSETPFVCLRLVSNVPESGKALLGT